MENSTKKVFVAFLDILGFKSYVLRHEDNLDKVKHFIGNLFSLSAMIGTAHVSTARYNQNNHNGQKLDPTKKIKKIDGSDAFLPNLDVSNINSILIFDSIVLWTNDDNENDFVDLVSVVRFILQSQLAIGFPLRGAISYGEFNFNQVHIQSTSMINHSTLVSPAQIYAMMLEKEQQWSGCVLDQNSTDRCKELNIDLDKNKLIPMVRYPVPLKNGNKNLYAIIWQGQVIEYVGGAHPADMNNYIRKSFLQNTDMNSMPVSTIQDIEEKIKNTTDFVLFSINHLSSSNSKADKK